MKKTLTALTALFLGAALYSASASYIITVDENGNGTLNNNGAITSLAWTMAAPDASIGGPVTLAYTLPFTLGNNSSIGDVVLYEDAAHTIVSDVIRFDGVNLNTLYFYSDTALNEPPSPADINGLPTVFGTDLFPYQPIPQLTETGVENGLNGYWGYTPRSVYFDPLGGYYYQPGYHGTPTGDLTTYNFISDVPEPTTMIAGALLLLPFGASTIRILRKRQTA